MNDPTYLKAEIEARPEWHVAWVLSEILNDNAPIGWSKYIPTAKCLLAAFEVYPLTSLREQSLNADKDQQLVEITQLENAARQAGVLGGAVWYHIKSGGIYRISTLAFTESELEPVVIYSRMPDTMGEAKSVGAFITWSRPLSEFMQRFQTTPPEKTG